MPTSTIALLPDMLPAFVLRNGLTRFASALRRGRLIDARPDPQKSLPALLVAPMTATEPSSERVAVFSGGYA